MLEGNVVNRSKPDGFCFSPRQLGPWMAVAPQAFSLVVWLVQTASNYWYQHHQTSSVSIRRVAYFWGLSTSGGARTHANTSVMHDLKSYPKVTATENNINNVSSHLVSSSSPGLAIKDSRASTITTLKTKTCSLLALNWSINQKTNTDYVEVICILVRRKDP